MAIEKITVWVVDGVKYDTEEDAKKAELRKFYGEIVDIIGRTPCNEIDVDDAAAMVIAKIRDMTGLSKKKLQKVLDSVE